MRRIILRILAVISVLLLAGTLVEFFWLQNQANLAAHGKPAAYSSWVLDSDIVNWALYVVLFFTCTVFSGWGLWVTRRNHEPR